MKAHSKIFGTLLMGALAAALTVVGGGVAQAAQVRTSITPGSGVFTPIQNVSTRDCLQPAGNTKGEAVIVQTPCAANDSNPFQDWEQLQVSGNIYQFVNQGSGLCIYMNGPVATGSPLAEVGCTTVSNELWNSSLMLPSAVTLTSWAGHRNTNLCLDATDGSTVLIRTCNRDLLSQRWFVGFPLP